MKAMILAAGFGSRLKPWTDRHPKALVPVDGVPMLERVILRLKGEGFDNLVVNVHHFGEQIIDFINSRDFGIRIRISDERDQILDTGGGIVLASSMLMSDDREPFLVHNVDILSDAHLAELIGANVSGLGDMTLLTSDRDSSRKLVFNPDGTLLGWHNHTTGEYRPDGFHNEPEHHENAFAGIYVMNAKALDSLISYSYIRGHVFPIMDFILSNPAGVRIAECNSPSLRIIDIGKPATLAKSSEFCRELNL